MKLVFSAGKERPTPEELVAIQREWPLIEAEMALVSAEIRVLTADPYPEPDDWRALRRAERRVLREAAALVARLIDPPDKAA